MQRRSRRILAAMSVLAAVTVTAPTAVASPQEAIPREVGPSTADPSEAAPSAAELAATRPAFRMPFECSQRWLGSNWNGHSPAHSIDWNHYDAGGSPDDYGRRVFASAGGTVLDSYYSTGTGYGNTIVVGHGNGWRTRYAHLRTRAVAKGDKVSRGQKLGEVGKSSALYNLSPHLHYEQIYNGNVVVSVVQGVTWNDYLKRYQTSTNRCG